MTSRSHAPPPVPPQTRIARDRDVVRLLDADGRVWTARDVQRTPWGTQRRYVPVGDPAAFEREFTPHDLRQRERRYRFGVDDDRTDQLANIVRQFTAAPEVER